MSNDVLELGTIHFNLQTVIDIIVESCLEV